MATEFDLENEVDYLCDELADNSGSYAADIAYRKGFLKALDLLEAELNRTHETKRYSQELINFINKLKARKTE